MKRYRRGFVLFMWTGLFPLNQNGHPVVFASVASAQRCLERYPSWGHDAVQIRRVQTRPGSNGRPDYILGAEMPS